MPQEIIKNGVSSKDNLSNHEHLRVSQQIKAALNNLQSEVTNSITAEKFYEIKDGTVHYHMDLVKQYLTTIKDKEWKGLKAENSSAWIMAVQIGLESLGKEEYDVGRIDGILRSKNQTESNTMKAIKKFQKDHGLTEDGLPGTKTINALLQAMNTNNTDTHNTDNNADNNNNANNNNADANNNNTDTHNNNIDLEKIQEFTNKLERDNHALYVENEHFKKLQGPYTTPDSITIIPGDLDTYIPSVNDIQKRIKTISDLPNMINLARGNDTKIQQYKTSLTQMGCTVEGTSIKKNGKEIGNLTRDLQTFNEADYDFNLLGKTLIKDYNEYQNEFGADSAKQQAKLEELLGILGMSLDKSTGKITDKKAQEVGTITLTNQEGVDNISEQEKKLSEAVTTVTENIKKVDKIIDENIAILQDSTKTEEEKMQAIQTIIDHNNFNYVKKITSGLPKEVSWTINNNYRQGIQGSSPAPLQLSLSCGDKHITLPEIPYKGGQWDKVGKFLIENFTNKNKAKQFKTEEEFKKAQQQCVDMLKKFDISSKSILNGLSFEISNQKGEKIGSLPGLWNNPNTPVITYESENSEFPKLDDIFAGGFNLNMEYDGYRIGNTDNPNNFHTYTTEELTHMKSNIEKSIHQRMKNNHLSQNLKGFETSSGNIDGSKYGDQWNMTFFDNNKVYTILLKNSPNGYLVQELPQGNTQEINNIAKLIYSSKTKNHELLNSIKISEEAKKLFEKYQLVINPEGFAKTIQNKTSYDIWFKNNKGEQDFAYDGLFIKHNDKGEIEFSFNENIINKINNV